jgi:hypothetical protein
VGEIMDSAETGHVALPIAGARGGGGDRGRLVRCVTAPRAIAVVSADAGHTLPQDDKRAQAWTLLLRSQTGGLSRLA